MVFFPSELSSTALPLSFFDGFVEEDRVNLAVVTFSDVGAVTFSDAPLTLLSPLFVVISDDDEGDKSRSSLVKKTVYIIIHIIITR